MADNETALEQSIYDFIAITPFFMKDKNLRVILDESIYNLVPKYIWLEEGREFFKLGISTQEFLEFFGERLIIQSIS